MDQETVPLIPSQTNWHPDTARLVMLFPQTGVFLTGIEASDPHVDGVRRNQLQEAHDFYVHYEARLEKIRGLGITWLRFGLPYSQVHTSQHQFDFTFMDKVMAKCQELGIVVIADLLHFGLPDWLHEESGDPYFQNRLFPVEFASYAAAFARRYPQIHHYTVVNEPFVTAHMSAKLGMWNEHRASVWDDDREFVRAGANIARAAILGRQALEQVWLQEQRSDQLIFMQNESFERAVAAPQSGREAEALHFNLRRFAILDLIFGHHDPVMQQYLRHHGLSAADYTWFMEHGSSTHTVLGIDHYPSCIHVYQKDSTLDVSDDYAKNLRELICEYWQRYPLPLLHTEVNAWPADALTICQQTYETLVQLRHVGYPVIGIGWYGDDLQVGWHVGLRGPQSFEESPVGLFYKGEKQPVADAFVSLLQQGFPAFQTALTTFEPMVADDQSVAMA